MLWATSLIGREGTLPMSALTAVRRGRLAAAVIPAIALGIAGIVVAQAGAEAAPKAPELHSGPRVLLGTTTNITRNAFTEAPDGAVYYSRGSTVFVVNGNSGPKPVLRAGGQVMALAANTSDVFALTGLTVTEYRRANGSKVTHWVLSSRFKPTSAGLIAVGGTLWSWTDFGTDSSGAEPAIVSRIVISGSAVQLVSKAAYDGDLSADATGLYFEEYGSSKGKLAHVTPSGRLSTHKFSTLAAGSPLALAGGQINLLQFGNHLTINRYSARTLTLISSKRVGVNDLSIAGTGLGLLVEAIACPTSHHCSTPTISKLNAATGSASGATGAPGAFMLLTGPSAVVIEISNNISGTIHLQRISS